MIQFISRYILKLRKFFYYGRVGMNLYDFDAAYIDHLILAHIKRVEAFMNSDDAHTVWTSKKLGTRRKLAEFKRLCEMKVSHDDFNDNYEFSKVYDIHGSHNYIDIGNDLFQMEPSSDERRKASNKAMKIDRMRASERSKRYYYMLEHYVPMFWD
jgi:hypothetical protein